LLKDGDAIAAKASGIEQLLVQVNIKGSEANLNFPGMLNEQIYSFAGLLEDADTAPNQQETQTYADLHGRLQAQLAAWNQLKTSEVTPFLAKVKGK
jgi:hypothetical protein